MRKTVQITFLQNQKQQQPTVTVSPGGFLRMNVQSLCRVSSMPRYPQALQELPMVCFLALICCGERSRYEGMHSPVLKRLVHAHMGVVDTEQVQGGRLSNHFTLKNMSCCLDQSLVILHLRHLKNRGGGTLNKYKLLNI